MFAFRYFQPVKSIAWSHTMMFIMPNLMIYMVQKQQRNTCCPYISLHQKTMVFPLTLCYSMPKTLGWLSTACNKPQLIYSWKEVSVSLLRKFKLATDKLWFNCGVTVKELIGTEQQFADLFIRANLTCQKPVEAIYYSVGSYPNCCCHCGSTRRLNNPKDSCAICWTCKNIKGKPVVPKRRNIKNIKK